MKQDILFYLQVQLADFRISKEDECKVLTELMEKNKRLYEEVTILRTSVIDLQQTTDVNFEDLKHKLQTEIKAKEGDMTEVFNTHTHIQRKSVCEREREREREREFWFYIIGLARYESSQSFLSVMIIT